MSYYVLLIVGIFAFTLLFLFSVLLQHSPRWLLTKDSSSLEARLAIKKLRNLKDEKEVYFLILTTQVIRFTPYVTTSEWLLYTGVC